MFDQLAHARPLHLIATDQHAIGAAVCDKQYFWLCAATLLGLGLIQLVEHGYDIVCYGIAQLDNVSFLHR